MLRKGRSQRVQEEAVQAPRVRRARPAVAEVAAPRVGRTRPAPAAVLRVRRVPEQSGRKPLFLIRWDGPLSYKFSIYMVTSFLYYIMSASVITDSDFDQLCKELNAGYDEFDHQHKHLVDRGQFAAGTGYAIRYPLMVRGAALHLLENHAER